MKKFIVNLLLKLITPEAIGQFMASAIAKLLRNASKKGGKTWDTSKEVIKQVRKWTNLFNQVYDDENLTEEEEQIIADEIANMTSTGSVTRVLSNYFLNN